MIDVRLQVHKYKKFSNFIENNQTVKEIECYQYPEGDLHVSIPIPPIVSIQKPQHFYCLNSGRHSGNFYLKIGAAGKKYFS